MTGYRDHRVVTAAGDLHALAGRIAVARELIWAELRTTNGEVGAQTFSEGGQSADVTTSVERTVIAREDLDAELLVGDDDVNEIIGRIRHLERWCNRAISTRLVPLEVPRCHSESTLAGYYVPLAEGGWHDPLCTNLPRYRTGRCDACRKRMERWRRKNQQPELNDDRSVDFDSVVTDGELGTVHTEPVRAA